MGKGCYLDPSGTKWETPSISESNNDAFLNHLKNRSRVPGTDRTQKKDIYNINSVSLRQPLTSTANNVKRSGTFASTY